MFKCNKDLKVEHCFTEVAGLKWHWVEAGSGEPVVLIHGLPESWYAWRNQIPALSEHFRLIVPDLKGYGQSDKKDGDYSTPNCSRELLDLFDDIGLESFSLASHDWGTVVGRLIAMNHPNRIRKFIHMSAQVWHYDPALVPHHKLLKDQKVATTVMRDTEKFIRGIFSRVTKRGLDSFTKEEIKTTIEEFSRPGTAEAVPRYFRDGVSEDVQAGLRSLPWHKLTMPVLVVQPDSDPLQPLYQFENVAEVIPGCKKLVVIKDSGHFTPAEQPEQVNRVMLEFFLKE